MRTFTITVLAFMLLISCGGEPGQVTDVTGTWEGEISGEGFQLDITARFVSSDGGISGTLDIPEQGARELELIDILLDEDSIGFSLPSNLGQADFSGTVCGDSMTGSFLQGGFQGRFILVRMSDELNTDGDTGEEIIIEGDDCVLAGSLEFPEGQPPYPCVILLSGSGLQDRDEYVFGFPLFAELSEIITASGYAVLRFDDRGTRGSTGGMESFSDSVLLYDAGLILDWALSDDRIDPEKIGILGHSEGSNTAFMLAAGRPGEVAFVISMAGPGVSGYELIPSQIRTLMAMQGSPQEEIDHAVELQYMLMDAVLADDSASVDSILRTETESQLAQYSEEDLASLGDLDAYVDYAIAAQLITVDSPWFRNFIGHDPADYMTMLDVPVLCLLGELDTQVIPDVNLGPLQEALAENPSHSIVVIDGANHLFQDAMTGGVDEYATLAPQFTQSFSDTLSAWLMTLSSFSE